MIGDERVGEETGIVTVGGGMYDLVRRERRMELVRERGKSRTRADWKTQS